MLTCFRIFILDASVILIKPSELSFRTILKRSTSHWAKKNRTTTGAVFSVSSQPPFHSPSAFKSLVLNFWIKQKQKKTFIYLPWIKCSGAGKCNKIKAIVFAPKIVFTNWTQRPKTCSQKAYRIFSQLLFRNLAKPLRVFLCWHNPSTSKMWHRQDVD